MGKSETTVEVLQSLGITAELTGTDMSEGAARVFASHLAAYPPQQVLAALHRCRLECKGRLALADVISRIDDGRPGADEAWPMIPADEAGSCVWTDEMAEAWGVACPLLKEGDRIGARMAFRDAYTRIVANGRQFMQAPTWRASLGTDLRGREEALRDAVTKGRLTLEHASKLMPMLPDNVVPLLEAPGTAMPEKVREQIAMITQKMTQEHIAMIADKLKP